MSKKLLVVVDYQEDFVTGSLGFPGAQELDEGIAEKIRQYAQEKSPIVVTQDTHGPDYLQTREGMFLPVKHCIQGTPGWQLYGQTRQAVEQLNQNQVQIIQKGAFGVEPQQLVEAMAPVGQVDAIEFVGVVTNICVLTNVCCFQALYPQAQITVDGGLCASFDPQLHQKTLEVLESLQVHVV